MTASVRSRSVGLVTEDPALYAELAGALRERRIPSVSLWPGDRIPERVAVVLTSSNELPKIRHPAVLAVGPEADRTAMWAAVEAALSPIVGGRRGEIVVGIDPGPRPGFAILSDDRLLVEGVLDSPEAAGSLAESLAQGFPGRGLRFRIGSGDPPARNRAVAAIGPQRLPVELVDERGTTPRVARRRRDSAAARAIARLPGRRLGHLPRLTATLGAITDIQRLSRESSGGRISISRALAAQVWSGTLTIPQAIARSVPTAGSGAPPSAEGAARSATRAPPA